MEIKLYNTLTKQKDIFKPIDEKEVRMYSCGPTVYKNATIGNMRTALMEDTLKNILEYNGYKVKRVMNITDVGHLVSDADEGEDKMEKSAREEKKTPKQIAKYYTDLYFKDLEELNISKADIICNATSYINEMIEYVKDLIKKGFAYVTPTAVFFDVSKLEKYPNLTNQKAEDQKTRVRIETDPNKKNPQDFALWIKANTNHLQKWENPWYDFGYPGWHIECSTMSAIHLGVPFDIHTGGIDLIPTHHENEIAQSFGRHNKMPSNFWVHGEFILIDGKKMSKSLGNVYLVSDIKNMNINPIAYRYFIYQGHYRSKINFTFDALKSSEISLNRLYNLYNIAKKEQYDNTLTEEFKKFEDEFLDAINDDMNMPMALSIVWKVAKYPKKVKNIADLLEKFDKVLKFNLKNNNIKDESKIDNLDIPDEVEKLILERKMARQNKNWQESDRLRDEIKNLGYLIKDTKDGYDLEKI